MQVPAEVDYERASSVENAIEILSRYSGEGRIIAGGHSLLPMMKLRLAQPEILVDISDLSELSGIVTDNDRIVIGSMTTHVALANSDLLYAHYPIISDAEKVIADPIVRNRGTIGGSLCQADPAEDLSAVFSALRATMVMQGPKGLRSVPLREFHTGPYTTVVEPDEVVTKIEVPLGTRIGSAYEKVERRVGDWAIAAVGAALEVQDGVIVRAGIGLAAVGAKHFVAPNTEEFLIGKPPTSEIFTQAGALAGTECSPTTDQRGPAEYKIHLVEVLTRRALTRAAMRSERN